MADTQQGVRQQSARDAAGTLETYDGDLRALFESVATVPAGSTFNEAFMLWLQDVTGSSLDNINDLAALFSSQQDDTYNWSSGGPLLGGGGPTPSYSYSPLTGGSLPGGSTLTRASGAQYFDGSQFNQVGIGVIRDAHRMFAGGDRGFIPEPLATNNMPNSADLNSAEWLQSGLASLTDQTPGSLNLSQFLMTNTTGVNEEHRVWDNGFVASSAFTWIVEQGTERYCIIRAGGVGGLNRSAFDLQDGLVTQTGGGQGFITDLGNNRYLSRFISDAPQIQFAIFLLSDTGTPGTGGYQYVGNGETLIPHHMQIESTIFATTPIITTGVPATREADVLDTGETIPAAYSLLVDVTVPQNIGSGLTISLMGASTSPVDILRVDENLALIMDDGGTPVTIGTVTAETRFRVSYGRDGSGRSASLDGATVVTGGAPAAGHQGETFHLGCTAGVNQSRSVHHITEIYDEKLSAAELETLSTPP